MKREAAMCFRKNIVSWFSILTIIGFFCFFAYNNDSINKKEEISEGNNSREELYADVPDSLKESEAFQPAVKLFYYDARRSRVQSVCSLFNITERLRNLTGCLGRDCPIYVFKTKELAYCLLRKVGSSSFSNDMLKIEGLSDKGLMLYKVIDDSFKRLSPKAFKLSKFKEYETFMFVRHPFSRLVSNFKDKADCDPTTPHAVNFYKKYFYKIMRRYRKDVQLSSRITFREFALYLIETPVEQFNDHWIPYWFSCEPCYMNYDFIGKIESFDEDREFLYKHLGLYETVPKFQKENKKSSNNDKKTYFSQLSKREIEKLYYKYKFDFDLFDYEPDEYYSYALN